MNNLSSSKRGIYITLGALIVLLIILVVLLNPKSSNNLQQPNQEQNQTQTNNTPCTQEVKICPDGTTITRTGPNCEFAPCPEKSVNTTEISNKPIVNIDENGFTPRELKIKAGTEVTFKNTGSQNHRPASDPHPTHTILPEFDSKKELKSGETYIFKFDKTGIWPCHDHLNPSARCTIIVE